MSELPPQFQEKLAMLQQLQQTLQLVLSEKQRLEVELSEAERALNELKNLDDNATIYKAIGSLLIKTERKPIVKELEEKRDFLNTRIMVLAKQEQRTRERLKEIQESIRERLKEVG
jgi:prefoldin beta subunit